MMHEILQNHKGSFNKESLLFGCMLLSTLLHSHVISRRRLSWFVVCDAVVKSTTSIALEESESGANDRTRTNE
eukprot:scaffold80927_cov42-Attheya_sp.AAC.9